VRQAALVSDKTKRVRGVYARRAIQIDDLYLFTFKLLPHFALDGLHSSIGVCLYNIFQ